MSSILYPCLLHCAATPKLSLGKRRKSITLPVFPTYLRNMAGQSDKKLKKKRKGVRFPPGVLMQQAITEGDIQEIKQLITDHGSKVVEEREPSGLPPVMRAIFESQVESLKLLVEAGADLTTNDQENWTALHVAAAMDDLEAAKFILNSCSANVTQVRNMDGERPIDLAESIQMARLLLQADLKELRIENTAAMSDAQDISETAILRLVNEHYEKNADCEPLNAVLKANTSFDTLLHLAASKNYPRLAKYVLKHGIVDTEMRDRRGWTPLHTAAYYNSLDVVLLLVEYGASVHTLADSYEKASDLTEHELILAVLQDEEGIDYV